MSVFIEARTEPFANARSDLANSTWDGTRLSDHPVRRPLRGHQPKEETYAVIRIMGPDGTFMPVFDAAGEIHVEEEGINKTQYWTNFLLQSVVVQRQECTQIVTTFGDSYLFLFGEQPEQWQCSGVLLNTADFNWRSEFWANYDKYFRATRLVELGARLYLIYDDVILEGYMTGAQAQEMCQDKEIIPFNFTIFKTGMTPLALIGDPTFPAPNDMDYTQLSSYETALQRWQQSRNLVKELTTEQILARSRSRINYAMGTVKFLTDAIRANIVNGGDPSISSFIQRASRAISLAISDASAMNATGNVFGGMSRSIPLRGTFRDNRDEFIGMEPDRSESSTTTSGAAAMDRWQDADLNIDSALNEFGSGALAASAEFADVMGRIGRAETEIRNSGGFRTRGTDVSRGVLAAHAVDAASRVITRDVPFGMMIADGEL